VVLHKFRHVFHNFAAVPVATERILSETALASLGYETRNWIITYAATQRDAPSIDGCQIYEGTNAAGCIFDGLSLV
jgi:hypothetical protein